MKHLKPILIILLACAPLAGWAQEVISSGGTHASSSGISLSWTIGEPVTETISNGSYILTQGFQQARLSASAIDDIPVPGLNLTVFPNPFTYLLNLKIEQGDYSQLQYSLLTMEGKILLNKKVAEELTQIEMQPYEAGNYLLRISRKSGEPLKTFKIIKQ